MADFFATTRPGTVVTFGETTFELPILYFRDDMFATFHTADADKVRTLMPSHQLHPVTLPWGRALVGIAAFNYIDTTIGPYGEVGVVVPAVYGKRPPLQLLPGLLEATYPGFGNLVLHLPVTKTEARDAGRGQWGYTKFVADMKFVNTPERFECRLAEGSELILSLRVEKRGLIKKDKKPLITYSVLDGNLIRTVIPQQGIMCISMKPRGSQLELGTHHVAESIRELDISPQPLQSRYYLQRSGILPHGEVIERNVRPLDGYYGSERSGEHTVIYQA